MPSTGMLLAVAVLVAAAFALLAFYLARPAVVSGTTTGSPAISTPIDQAQKAAERTSLRGPVCSSSICNPNAGEVQHDRNSSADRNSSPDAAQRGGIQLVP